jgi:hypothetical protein
LVVLASLVAAPAAGTAASSGLHGYVEKGPIRPVCVANEPCNGPAGGVLLTFQRGSERTRVRTKTRPNGFYRVVLPAGVYTVTTSAGFDRIPFPARVKVRARHDDRLDFFLDTGIQ